MTQPPDVTGLLVAWSNGDADANDRLIDAVYGELRALARGYLRRKRSDHSLAHRVPLLDIDVAVDPEALDVIALDAALVRLAALDRRQSRLVELRFFGGLTGDEIATVIGVAPITVKRDWALARAWLFRELRGEAQ